MDLSGAEGAAGRVSEEGLFVSHGFRFSIILREASGELLGFDEVLGTDVLLEERMPAMPKLPNGNNKGAVKVERLRERNVLPEHGVLENAVAYSDSAADLPMLLSCRRKVLVNPSPALKEDRLLDGAECLYPARPWKGRFGKIWRIGFFVMGLVDVNNVKSMTC